MGDERVLPKGIAPMTAKEVHRRFTDIWRMVEGHWFWQQDKPQSLRRSYKPAKLLAFGETMGTDRWMFNHSDIIVP
jgi:hypothetical protein